MPEEKPDETTVEQEQKPKDFVAPETGKRFISSEELMKEMQMYTDDLQAAVHEATQTETERILDEIDRKIDALAEDYRKRWEKADELKSGETAKAE